MNKLNVELYGVLIGTLSLYKGRLLDFVVNPAIFENYQLSSTIMSVAVPLNLRYSNAHKKRAANFFIEFLPEGRNLEWLMQSLPKGEQTTFGVLRKYGRDIAGALTIYDSDELNNDSTPEAQAVDSKEIRYLLEHMPQASLANSPVSGRTSLGGVQGKIVLAKINSSWHRVHYGYPSTHILKPVVSEYPSMIYDEAYCMQLAYNCGLISYTTRIETFDGIDALVIERYDRIENMSGNKVKHTRVHQEDFNQALGAHSSEKYQEYGGKVSAKRIAQILLRFGSNDDIRNFAAQLIFAIAIGNLDMHAKNISILHFPDDTISLAPTYDQVPLRHQNADGKMALAVNGKYFHTTISISDIAAELLSWQCPVFHDESETVAFIEHNLKLYRDTLSSTPPVDKAYPKLISDISEYISNLLSGKCIGS